MESLEKEYEEVIRKLLKRLENCSEGEKAAKWALALKLVMESRMENENDM